MKSLTIALLFLLTLAHCGKIRELTESTMQKFSNDNSYWFIQISKSPCPNCKKHQGTLEDLSDIFDGAVKVGKIDAKLIPSLPIKENPTYMFTRSDQPQKSVPYDGIFDRKEIAKFCLERLSSFFAQREKSGGKAGGKKEKASAGANDAKPKASAGGSQSQTSSTTNVIELNDKTFKQKVLDSKDAWFVQFYSPGCGHCRSLEPEYNKLPKMIGKRVHIAKVDGNNNQQLMGQYKIQGFPTMYLFDTQNKGQPVTYEGERTAEAIVGWLKTQNINQQKKQVFELTQKTYDSECNRNIICLIIFTTKSQRTKLTFLKHLLKQHQSMPIRFMLSESRPTFQTLLMIQDRSTPKMVGIWNSLNSYRIYNGEMSEEGIDQFLKNLVERRKWIKFGQNIGKAIFKGDNQQL